MGTATGPLTQQVLDRIRELRAQGRGKIMIGRATGLPPERVRQIMSRQEREEKQAPEQVRAKAQALADQGRTADEIAEAMGKSRSAIKAMGLRMVMKDEPEPPVAEDYEFRLVLNVLIQAARDLTARQDDIRRSAHDWIMSDSLGVMSFRWICDHCDIDYRTIRSAAARPNQLRESIRATTRRHASKKVSG